jgi:hypothetical protein
LTARHHTFKENTMNTTYERAPPRWARAVAAALLRTAGRTLDRLGDRLAAEPRRPVPLRSLEFHAEAGAPEGALYVNGELVGFVAGVNRL